MCVYVYVYVCIYVSRKIIEEKRIEEEGWGKKNEKGNMGNIFR